jgi:hypothetical protein
VAGMYPGTRPIYWESDLLFYPFTRHEDRLFYLSKKNTTQTARKNVNEPCQWPNFFWYNNFIDINNLFSDTPRSKMRF